MKEQSQTHLTGEMEVHDGRAPRAGWAPINNEMTRTEDVWLTGDPLTLPDDQEGWRRKLETLPETPDFQAALPRTRF